MRKGASGWPQTCGILTALLCYALTYQPASAATTNVSIVDFAFSPPAVTIKVNDQVKWNWTQLDEHSTTSDLGLWDSGVHGLNFSYAHAFPAPGNFPYHCSVHFFAGSVTVISNSPPTVSLTNPPDQTVLSAPASVALRATASDLDGSVTNVQFLQGNVSCGNVPNPPFSRTVTNLSAGDYTFSAVASDSAGLKATNSITLHVVTPPPITLTAATWTTPSTFAFNFSATPGLSYSVESTSDFKLWTVLATNIATEDPVKFTDNNARGSNLFYRVRLRPNP